jgi:hypothetical protein
MMRTIRSPQACSMVAVRNDLLLPHRGGEGRGEGAVPRLLTFSSAANAWSFVTFAICFVSIVSRANFEFVSDFLAACQGFRISNFNFFML